MRGSFERSRNYDGRLSLNRSIRDELTYARRRGPFRLIVIRYGLASVWLFHGVFAKLLGLIPRQQAIVGRVVGAQLSGAATALIGVVEVLIALWILSGKASRWCAALMTLMLAAMNTLELTYARDLLLAPAWMVGANTLLAGMAWYLALGGRTDTRKGFSQSSAKET